jgi:hypothetical protein
MGVLARIPGLWFSPKDTSKEIAADPKPWIALLCVLLLNLAFTTFWMQKASPVEFMKIQNEESGALDKMEPAQRAQALETQAKVFPIFAWVGPFVFIPALILGLGFLNWLIFRFAYSAADLTFKQSAGIVGHNFLAVGVITLPLTLLIMFMKGDWNLNPTEVIGANLGVLLDRGTASKAVYHLAKSIDLFTLWSMFLLAIGYGAAIRKPTSSAIWGVAIPWLVFVLGVAAWKAAS